MAHLLCKYEQNIYVTANKQGNLPCLFAFYTVFLHNRGVLQEFEYVYTAQSVILYYNLKYKCKNKYRLKEDSIIKLA